MELTVAVARVCDTSAWGSVRVRHHHADALASRALASRPERWGRGARSCSAVTPACSPALLSLPWKRVCLRGPTPDRTGPYPSIRVTAAAAYCTI